MGDPGSTWRFMGTYNPKYKSTYNLLRGHQGAYKYSYKWGFKV